MRMMGMVGSSFCSLGRGVHILRWMRWLEGIGLVTRTLEMRKAASRGDLVEC
jgi:hypothetical protein